MTAYQLQNGGFADAAWAHNGDNAAALYVHVDPVQDDLPVALKAEVTNADDRIVQTGIPVAGAPAARRSGCNCKPLNQGFYFRMMTVYICNMTQAGALGFGRAKKTREACASLVVEV